MTYTIGTIRRFKTARFTVVVDAIEDDSSIHDLHSEPEAQKEIAEKLDSGEWILFCARARVYADGRELASDYLGGCIYESLEAFMDHKQVGAENRRLAAAGERGRCGSYFADMVHNVCAEARKALSNTPRVRMQS